MASTATSNGPVAARPKKAAPTQVKILMLHGYTQSGPLFRAKVRAVEKRLTKALLPSNRAPTFLYPTAPNRLRPRDIPGYQPPPPSSSPSAAADDQDEGDSWAWFRKSEASGAYRLLPEGMARLATTIASAGGVDGIVGFSQGGCVAALLAAALEVPHRAVPADADTPGYAWGWVDAVREANAGRPLGFCAVYSGFFGPARELAWLYEPRIRTPTLHFLGGLDTVVEEGRSRGLVERCEGAVVVVHPGGHFVPVSKEWVTPLEGFVLKYCRESGGDGKEGGAGEAKAVVDGDDFPRHLGG